MWTKFEKIFDGSSSSLKSSLYAADLPELTAALKAHLKNKLVLYTDHIETKYLSRRWESNFLRVPARHYLDLFADQRRLQDCEPSVRMTLFAALDVPLAMDRGMTLGVFGDFVAELLDAVDRARKTSGDYVGVEAAQSLSERLTQSALNTFHSAGAKKSVVVGMRRVKEILDATLLLKTPMLGPFRTETDPDKLVAVVLRDLVKDIAVRGDRLRVTAKDQRSLERFVGHLNANRRFKEHAEVENLEVSMPADIKIRWDATVSGLPNSAESVVESDGEMFIFFHTHRPIPRDLTLVSELCPDVDLTTLRTNSAHWIADTLGISAAEHFMALELDRVLGGEGIHINHRHIALIAANMCVSGQIRANTFNGLKSELCSVIRRATFERGMTVFASAALKRETDYVADVSSKVMMAADIDVSMSEVYDETRPSPRPLSRFVTRNETESETKGGESPEYAPLDVNTDEESTGESDAGSEDGYYPASPTYAPCDSDVDLSVDELLTQSTLPQPPSQGTPRAQAPRNETQDASPLPRNPLPQNSLPRNSLPRPPSVPPPAAAFAPFAFPERHTPAGAIPPPRPPQPREFEPVIYI